MREPRVRVPIAEWQAADGRPLRAAYEHPWFVRIAHWVTAVSLAVLAASGLQIFVAFPSFGPKVPQRDFWSPPEAVTLGGWLAGALQWHFTFMWIFMGAGAVYVAGQMATGHYRTVLFTPRDAPGVWPMMKHYFFFGTKPPQTEPYNPLQKLAYTATLFLGAVMIASGLVMYKPVQLSGLAWLLGGYEWARVWHFVAMCGLIAFVPGHLLMVALHGWSNFVAMWTGWKRSPEYVVRDRPAS